MLLRYNNIVFVYSYRQIEFARKGCFPDSVVYAENYTKFKAIDGAWFAVANKLADVC